MWHCRMPEQLLNKCIFDSLGLKKTIPGAPTDEVPVNERKKQIFSEEFCSMRLPDEVAESYLKNMKEKDARRDREGRDKVF